VDEILKERALAIIREHPFKHIALTLPFLWRGAFISFPVLLAALIYAVHRSMPTLGVFVLPALGLLLFYALFSHFIPNYAVPTLPVVIICAMRLLGDAISANERKWVRLHGNELP
jgi:hypothetical protein